ncbi:hypothetical protein CRENBAI_000188 [Crenichthys baileyi]|uniref:Uncharacterized protein n=1 Tax=Crenichthys baileyi TaxID=28760 RepID=A0AAV9SQS0_9TELE
MENQLTALRDGKLEKARLVKLAAGHSMPECRPYWYLFVCKLVFEKPNPDLCSFFQRKTPETSRLSFSHEAVVKITPASLSLHLSSSASYWLHPLVKTCLPSNEPRSPAALTATLDSITPLKAWIISFHMAYPT